MDQKQLQYFITIAEEGNITKAAKRLFLPEPYMSNQLKRIERELGVQLAVRSTRRLQLTDAGKHFKQRAEQILEIIDATGAELENFDSGKQGTLAIGAVSTLAVILLSDTIQQFHQRYPQIKFKIRNMSTQSIREALKMDMIEVGIVRTPFDTKLFNVFSLPEQPMVAAKSTKYENDERIIKITGLAEYPLIVNYRFTSIIRNACHMAGIVPNIICEVDDTRSVLTWAAAGMGVAVIPKDWIHIVPGINLYYKEIDAPVLYTSSNLVWLRKHALSSVAKNFITLFEEQINRTLK
ncbi:LysR family transcriptional regulator [Pectinatus frisingensis]|uniref:LysR family transcriptional regulator n=1 Tax=Pectinatus frisingensis TaxID=865 RepID=UPI0018C8396B|nr:LysR family transcriptional regulator [Pectinatus frisingensis]